MFLATVRRDLGDLGVLGDLEDLNLDPHLHSDVEPRNIEGLEHDLGRVLSVLRCVEWRLRLRERRRRPSAQTLRNESVTSRVGFHTQGDREQRCDGAVPAGSSGPPARLSGI